MGDPKVDAFVRARVQPEHQTIVAMLRKLMLECAPNSVEAVSYGIPVWRQNLIIAVLSPTKKDITFAFSRGAEFRDKYRLLRGAGTKSKHVKIKDLTAVNMEALRYYIKQAVALDAKAKK